MNWLKKVPGSQRAATGLEVRLTVDQSPVLGGLRVMVRSLDGR